MKERKQKELINLLSNFNENLDCHANCGTCEYDILRN